MIWNQTWDNRSERNDDPKIKTQDVSHGNHILAYINHILAYIVEDIYRSKEFWDKEIEIRQLIESTFYRFIWNGSYESSTFSLYIDGSGCKMYHISA